MKKVLYILGELSDPDVEWIIGVGHKERLAPGATLIREGNTIGSLYIVLDGNLSVLAPGGVEVAQLGAGEMIGEVSFVDSRPTSATVKALQASTVLGIPRDQLNERLQAIPEFAARFYRALAVFLSYRLRDTNSQLGYGPGTPRPQSNREDELDDGVMDNLYLAGTRFERILKRLADNVAS